ncbi:MAG: DUF359 domain-containing protein [Desulfurococcaceae archaeon]
MQNSNRGSPVVVPALILPQHLRQDLSLPQGTLYVHPERGVVKGLRVKVLVGDVVSTRHFADIKVVDHKTKRTKIDLAWEECTHVLNPPGSVSLNSLTMSSLPRGVICVLGEEDLITLSYMVKNQGSIAYGQPDTGVVLVEPRAEIALKVLKILKPGIVHYIVATGGVKRG